MNNNTRAQHLIENIMKTPVAALLTALLALGTACGEAIDINRVAPNAVKKTQFDGEWFYRQVVVDKQYHTAGSFVGVEGGLERIKWEVTENLLIGYRSYERVPGADPTNPGEQNVLITFPITSHFDIRRQYNATNGVESNVIEENDYDRPWFEREFMRVEWMNAGGPAGDMLVGPNSLLGGINRAIGNAVNRDSNETPNYPWKTRLSDDYMETTLDTMAMPDPYICYYLDGLSPCNGASVKLKLSFRKVKPTDYQALDYPDFVENTEGGMELADTAEPVLTSTVLDNLDNAAQRICTPAEMGPDGTGKIRIARERVTLGAPPNVQVFPRMCNTDPGGLGDDPSECEEVVGRCVPRGDNLVGITPPGSDSCDLTRMSPDDCIELTTSVFSRFGYFRTDRFQIDRENGTQYTNRERLINRHNMWAQSVGTDGSVLPMSARPVKPIVYYMNVGFPTDMVETAQAMADDWNVAFLDAVAAARNITLTELPENLNEGFDGFPEVKRVFEIRQNSCNIAAVNAYADEHGMKGDLAANGIAAVAYGNLEEACAVLEFASQARKAAGEDITVFTWEQLGDLRYSFVNWAAKAELAGPLGYGPSAADPLTGEIISANANIYGASIDTYANWGADIVQLLNGELTTNDIMNGTAAREHVEGVRNRWAQRLPEARVDAFLRLFDQRANRLSDAEYYKELPATAVGRGMRKLRDSGVEQEFLLTSETLKLFGHDLQAQQEGRISDRMLENARPSNWAAQHVPSQLLVAANSGQGAAAVRDAGFASSEQLTAAGRLEELADYLGRHNACYLAEQTEPAIVDLATQLADENASREEIVQFIRKAVFRGVTAHELGHTFGLRHNFEGSADALNYFPDYWGVGADGLPEHQQHLLSKSPRKSEVQYSTIMDYHQRFNSDFAGIGLYDKAAIKLGYSETVEVFDETTEEFVARDWITNTFLLSPEDFPKLVAGRGTDADIQRLFDEAYELAYNGDETVLMDIAGSPTIEAKPENLYKRKNIPLKDWYRNEFLQGFVRGLDDTDCVDIGAQPGRGCMQAALQSFGLTDDDGTLPKVTVPYSYCADEFAFGGNLTCNRWDYGATSSEIVKNAGEMYEFYYPFDAFRRDRVLNPFSSWAGGYMNRLQSRTYQPMLNAYRFFYFYRRAQTLRIYPTVRDWASAALQGMDFFVRVMQQPEPGTYCRTPGADAADDADDVYVNATEVDACDSPVEIGLDQGRFYNSTWDNEYDFRPQSLGNYWDKALALQAMTSSDAFFFRDFSQETNRGAFSIGYYRIFQNEMLDLFGAVMRDDPSVFSPRITVEDGEAVVNYQPFLKTGIYGEPLPEAEVVGTTLKPTTSFQLRSYAAIFGFVNMTSTLDQTLDFAQRSRITLAGQAGDPSLVLDRDGDGVDDLDVIEFTDPVSQMVYRSAAFDDVEHAPGYLQIAEAKAFAEGEWQAKKDALDAAVTPADIETAQREFDRANNKLNEKLQMVDFLVYIGDIFEFAG
jgi:hypothetical protein